MFHGDREIKRLRDLDAVWGREVSKANRVLNKIGDLLDSLLQIESLERSVETLLGDRSARIRLWAAESLIGRTADKAIPVLGRLPIEDLHESSPDIRLSLRSSAAFQLYMHFNIRSFDQNDLIEPLRRHGVELPPLVRPE